MKIDNLYNLVLKNLKVDFIHPLHKAMLEECCENALDNDLAKISESQLVNATRIAFISCHSLMQATLKSAIDLNNADIVTLNYRGQQFKINRDASILKGAEQ